MIAPAQGGYGQGGFGELARLIADSGSVRRRFDMLTQQASDGLIADTFSGLGGTASVAISLHPQIASLRAAQDNIDAADGRARVTQTAMTQIQSVASSLLSQLTTLNGLNPSTVDSVAANARDALAAVGNLLNSRFGDVYVFAGEDTANPPVPNPDQLTSSGFFTGIASAVGGLAASGATAVAATTLTIAASNTAGESPFSTFLSQPAAGLSPPLVATGDGRTQSAGLLASANTNVASAGGSTTGSYMRDLMRALATVGSLTSGQVNDPGFASLVGDTRASLSGAITAMATDTGVLGEKQSSLAARKTGLQDTATALMAQLSAAEDVDMAATLSNLSQTQTQLQASYQLISAAHAMSLVKFLPGG